MSKNTKGNFFALMVIIVSGFSIIKWKKYEQEVLKNAKMQPTITVSEEIKPSPEIVSRVNLLQKMAINEKEKIRVMVEHDNSPLTNTYPMILDATT